MRKSKTHELQDAYGQQKVSLAAEAHSIGVLVDEATGRLVFLSFSDP